MSGVDGAPLELEGSDDAALGVVGSALAEAELDGAFAESSSGPWPEFEEADEGLELSLVSEISGDVVGGFETDSEGGTF